MRAGVSKSLTSSASGSSEVLVLDKEPEIGEPRILSRISGTDYSKPIAKTHVEGVICRWAVHL